MTLPARISTLSLALLLTTCLATAGYVHWRAKQAEPAYAGTLTVAGLSAPVQITFGPHAVPTIRAATREDLFFAQGYVLASERMWQMDLMRRVAGGTLAEVLGERALPADRLFRTLGLGRAARRNLAVLSDEVRGYLDAYARGVNAYRGHAARRLPLEYRIAGFEPAPWQPADSLAIGEYMAFLLSVNLREEVVYLRLAHRLGPERVLELFPTDEGVPAPAYARELPDYALETDGLFDTYDRLATEWGLPRVGAASNSWAVSGAHTRIGLPLLANDPHLSPTMPGIWYELEMQAPGYHVAGTSLPGLPLVLIGHNEDLAWGFTAAMADTQDLFVERPTRNARAVERPGGGQEPIVTRMEEITVKGQGQAERLVVRQTSNGVIINDILGRQTGTPIDLVALDTPRLLALRWSIERPNPGLDGLYGLNTARTVGQAREAVRRLTHPSLNVLIAHRDGDVAWQVSGSLPVRRKGLGTFPSPGWTGEFGWSGYLPSQDNPGTADPQDGLLVSANHRTIPLNYPAHVTRSWMAPYRALRIQELLKATGPLSPEDLAWMQLDREGIEARRFIQALRKLEPVLRRVDPEAWEIASDHLLDWDGRFQPESGPAALMFQVRQALYHELYGDELKEDLSALMAIAIVSYNALQETVYSGESSFWDDTSTREVETPAHIWGRAIRRAWATLDDQQGDPRRARLDRLRQLVFPHAFHNVPLLGRLFDVGPMGTGGDSETVNVMKTAPTAPQRPLFVPSYRFIFTPGDWTETRGTQPLGQSGHRFSPYRTDQLSDWLQGHTHPWPWGGPAAEETIGTLTIRPADSPEPSFPLR